MRSKTLRLREQDRSLDFATDKTCRSKFCTCRRTFMHSLGGIYSFCSLTCNFRTKSAPAVFDGSIVNEHP